MEYAQLYKKNKKMCGFSQRCIPSGVPKICFGGFYLINTQITGICECAGVTGNYGISKLKLFRNLTSTQAKKWIPSSLDSSLD